MSKIEWTEKSLNPVVGCTKVSAGCDNCYAAAMAKRLKAMGTPGYENGFSPVTLLPDRLKEPIRRKKPTRYFICSMGDLFHPRVPMSFIRKVINTIEQTPQHTYQILTKRPVRMETTFYSKGDTPSNVWIGTTVENRNVLSRIKTLRWIRAKVRFLSIEPLLEDLGEIDLTDIHWVIVGGENGPGARRMEPVWVESIFSQCQAANIPFFFKGWGKWNPDGYSAIGRKNRRIFRGRTWDQMPEAAKGM